MQLYVLLRFFESWSTFISHLFLCEINIVICFLFSIKIFQKVFKISQRYRHGIFSLSQWNLILICIRLVLFNKQDCLFLLHAFCFQVKCKLGLNTLCFFARSQAWAWSLLRPITRAHFNFVTANEITAFKNSFVSLADKVQMLWFDWLFLTVINTLFAIFSRSQV